LLSIARCQNYILEPRALELYTNLYTSALNFVELYPQYYRFILGIVLDLEDMGMKGKVGEEICQYIKRQNLLAFDTSDLRRLEVIHLLNRRTNLSKSELEEKTLSTQRIEKFTASTDKFFKFNRPLFYELTHAFSGFFIHS